MTKKKARLPPSGVYCTLYIFIIIVIWTLTKKDECSYSRYRYRKWDLGNDVVLVARCEHDAVMAGANNEIMFLNIKALNEWDSKVSGVSRTIWL